MTDEEVLKRIATQLADRATALYGTWLTSLHNAEAVRQIETALTAGAQLKVEVDIGRDGDRSVALLLEREGKREVLADMTFQIGSPVPEAMN